MEELDAMYLKMASATEQAINILIKAQQECEEMYISKKSNSMDNKIHIFKAYDKPNRIE